MKHAEAIRPVPKPLQGKLAEGAKNPATKPVGPVTYTVSKGSDVFWSAKGSRK